MLIIYTHIHINIISYLQLNKIIISRLFKYIDNIPTITVLPPDNLMEGNSNDGSKFNRLMISDNTTEIIQSPIEIITVPS